MHDPMHDPRRQGRRFKLVTAALAFVAMISLLSATVAYATFSGLTWTATGPGTKTVTPGTGGSVSFNYSFDAPSYEPLQMWQFSAPAQQSATIAFQWSYNGFHGWFLDRAVLQVFAAGPSGTTVTTLVNTPNCESCAGEIDGPFSFSGTTSLQVHQGYPFGVIVQGSNFDCCAFLTGTVNLTPLAPPDSTPPVITPNVSGTLGNNGWYTSNVAVSWTVTDPESAISSSSGCTTSTMTADTTGTTFTCTATSAGGTSSQSVTIKRDTTAPAVTCAVTPNRIWPPNHKMVDVSASVNVTDATAGPAGFKLISATSNEPDDGLGDGDTANDLQGWTVGTPDTAGQVRAERSGSGSGRVYTLTYSAADQAGNAASCSVSVSVPRDQRN